MIAFIDEELDLEIVESIRSTEIVTAVTSVYRQEDLTEFLQRADFPRHKLIVHTKQTPTKFCIKESMASTRSVKQLEPCKKKIRRALLLLKAIFEPTAVLHDKKLLVNYLSNLLIV